MTHRKRAFTALVAGALALPLLATPAFAGHGGPQAGPPQPIADFCTNPFPENFVDVAATDVFAQAIQCISTAGRESGEPITRGGPEGRPANQYGPNLANLRGQMASFIARMLDAAEARDRAQFTGGTSQIQALPPYDGQNEFNDVPANFTHVAAINRLADANIALGGPNGAPANTYGPNQSITRAQMATFINRAAAFAMSQNPLNAGSGTGYTTTNDYFVDEDQIAIHREEINGLASVGIVVGVQPESAHRYAPRDNVTRAQMAGFLSRTLSQLFDDNRVHSLLEVFTGNVRAPGDADQATEAGGSRSFEVAGLNPATEYRVTAVDCANVTRGANDLVTFADANGDGFADTGDPDAVVTITGGTTAPAPGDNTATGRPGADGVLRFEISSPSAECVTAAIYINGAAGRSLEQGGTDPRLEVDANGRPEEFFGITGETTFEDPAPTIVDAFVATDGGEATVVDSGDVWELSFSEAVASDAATATETITVTGDDEAGDPVTFTVVCSGDITNDDDTTDALCTLSADGLTLTVELLEEPQGAGGVDADPDVVYPLTIDGLTGLVDSAGQPVNVPGSPDRTIDITADTVED